MEVIEDEDVGGVGAGVWCVSCMIEGGCLVGDVQCFVDFGAFGVVGCFDGLFVVEVGHVCGVFDVLEAVGIECVFGFGAADVVDRGADWDEGSVVGDGVSGRLFVSRSTAWLW